MTYDHSPDDERFDYYEADYEYDDAMSLFETAMERDEVAPGFHRDGPYVIEVLANGDVDIVSTVVLPSRVGWEPTF